MNPYPIRMCGLGRLAGGAAIAVPDELRELSEKVHETEPLRFVASGGIRIIGYGQTCDEARRHWLFQAHEDLPDAYGDLVVGCINFVRSLLAPSPPSDMVTVPREELKRLLSRKYDFYPSLKDTLCRLKPGGLTGHDWTDRDAFDQVIRLLDFLSGLVATAPTSDPNQKENP